MASVLKEVIGFDRSLTRLAHLIRIAARPRTVDRTREALAEYALLRLHDVWAFRCRQIVLRSAVGGFVTRGGHTISRAANLPSGTAPLDWLRRSWANQKTMKLSWEPDWFLPDNCIRAARLLGTANLASISGGIGASQAAIEVRTIRNLIAHSLPNTWTRYRGLTMPLHGVVCPNQVILAVDVITGKNQFSRWASDFRASLVAACA